MNYTFQFGVVLARWPEFLEGALITMQLALAGFWLGAPFGAVLRLGAHLRAELGEDRLVGAYVIFLTNIPVLIQVWFLYFGLPDARHPARQIHLRGHRAGWSRPRPIPARSCGPASSRCTAPRSRRRRRSASRGCIRSGTWSCRISSRTIYPALANYFIVMTLSTSMAMIVGINELTGAALYIASENYRNLEAITVAAVLYILITFAMSLSLALVGRWAFRVKAKIF